MANLGGSYEAGNETMGDNSPLPAGEYQAALVKSDRKEAKSGNGNEYVNLEFEVQDGEFQGRRFWSTLNLWNGNAQAVEIAQRELNSLMHAAGKLRVEDTEELHGIPVVAKLKVQPGKGDYGPSNRVVTYKALNAAGRPASGGTQSSGGSKPWGNRAA